MNDFRREQRRRGRRTIDGFLGAGAPAQPSGQDVGRRSIHLDGLRTSGRRMDDFKRGEGYYPAQPTAVRAQAAPELPKPVERQQHSMLHMALANSEQKEKLSRRERRRAKKEAKTAKRGRWYSIRKWTFRSALVLAVLVLIGGSFLGLKAFTKVRKVLKGGGQAAALQTNVKPELLKGEGDGRINILLLGRGGDGHDGPDLTDTLLVASIDPVNKTASLVSIPRDLWVTVPTYGSMKINAVYANAKYRSLNSAPKDTQKAETAGISAIESEITDVLGIPIHYYGMVDFHAFQQAVDTVGGVDINIAAENAVTDYMYDETTHRPYTLNVPAGQQHFDGLRALMYVRTRHTSPRGDFDRTERQRLFIEALSQKVLSAGTYTNPLKISQLMSDFGDNVSTDFSVNDALRMMQIGKGIAGTNIKSVGLSDPPNNYLVTDNVSGASVVRPTAGFGDYSDIQNYVRNTLRDPYLSKENAAVTVLNGTSVAGLAGLEGDKLKSYGYNVINVSTAPTETYDKTIIVDLTAGKKPFTKHYLEQRLNATTVTKLPDSTIQAPGADFVVILGQDAATSSKN